MWFLAFTNSYPSLLFLGVEESQSPIPRLWDSTSFFFGPDAFQIFYNNFYTRQLDVSLYWTTKVTVVYLFVQTTVTKHTSRQDRSIKSP